MSDDIIPIRPPRVIDETGGSVDEIGLTLAIYGDELDPDAVSARLGCAPTTAHRKRDQRRTGAWLLSVRAEGIPDADALVELLLARLPSDEQFWNELRGDYTVQIRVGVHMDQWNRGFQFSAPSIQRFAVTGAPVLFDVYSYGDAGD